MGTEEGESGAIEERTNKSIPPLIKKINHPKGLSGQERRRVGIGLFISARNFKSQSRHPASPEGPGKGRKRQALLREKRKIFMQTFTEQKLRRQGKKRGGLGIKQNVKKGWRDQRDDLRKKSGE